LTKTTLAASGRSTTSAHRQVSQLLILKLSFFGGAHHSYDGRKSQPKSLAKLTEKEQTK